MNDLSLWFDVAKERNYNGYRIKLKDHSNFDDYRMPNFPVFYEKVATFPKVPGSLQLVNS